MTEIIPTDMDEHYKALIDHPLSSRRAYRDALEQRVIRLNQHPEHVEALIEAQTAEPIRHARASRWERIKSNPRFIGSMVAVILASLIVDALIVVRFFA